MCLSKLVSKAHFSQISYYKQCHKLFLLFKMICKCALPALKTYFDHAIILLDSSVHPDPLTMLHTVIIAPLLSSCPPTLYTFMLQNPTKHCGRSFNHCHQWGGSSPAAVPATKCRYSRLLNLWVFFNLLICNNMNKYFEIQQFLSQLLVHVCEYGNRVVSMGNKVASCCDNDMYSHLAVMVDSGSVYDLPRYHHSYKLHIYFISKASFESYILVDLNITEQKFK